MAKTLHPQISAIRETRLRLGITQKTLAANSGVSLPTIWNMESGANSNPTIGTIEKLQSALARLEGERAAPTQSVGLAPQPGTLTCYGG